MATLREEIASIPGSDGWWKRSSEETFQRIAKDLQNRGIDERVIVVMLHDLYYAASACFGE